MSALKQGTLDHIRSYLPAAVQPNAIHVARVAAGMNDFRVTVTPAFIEAARELEKAGVVTKIEQDLYELKVAFR